MGEYLEAKNDDCKEDFYCPKLDKSCEEVCRMCSLFTVNTGMSSIVRNDEATM